MTRMNYETGKPMTAEESLALDKENEKKIEEEKKKLEKPEDKNK